MNRLVVVSNRVPALAAAGPQAGGLTVALARAFKILDPKVKNPQSVHWERAMAIFDLLF